MKTNYTRWTSPVLGQNAEKVYAGIYGEHAEEFMHILESSPYEIAVVSRLIAYYQKMKEGEQ